MEMLRHRPARPRTSAGPLADARRPGWVRPALLGIAAVSAFCYGWRAFRPVNIEIYYAAAARSMSLSPRNFFFGAFDPAGTVTTDKLPGALWVQAVSVRAFGAHPWALVLPQVIEGTVTVLVLYRVVRRLAGPAAGVFAAGILAVSPATVALNRGNIPDTLMILLTVLAADAAGLAVSTGRLWPILLAGAWIGLAFQAKMLQAWLVVPALAACYLIAAPGTARRRLGHAGAMVMVTAAVSLSWMTAVTLLPGSLRPYVDGSYRNSVFQQVFVYNGFGRLDQPTPDQLLDRSIRIGLPAPAPPAWDRLLTGPLGRDTGWLLAAALVALAAGLIARRTEPRNDPVRACLLLWGTWLGILWVVFSVSPINAYYTAALSPAVAGLLGTGLALAWQFRDRFWTRIALGGAVLAAAGTCLALLPSAGTGRPAWLRPALAGLALAALGCLAALIVQPARAGAPARTRPRAAAGLAAAAVALSTLAVLIVPAVAAASVVASRLGPFETPFEPPHVTASATRFFGAGFRAAQTLPAIEAANVGLPDLMATQTSALAAPFIWASGAEVLPIGGFTGTIPEPTLRQLQSMIRRNDVRTFIQSPATTDPRLEWIARHCFKVPAISGPAPVLPISVYYCTAANSG